MDILKLDKGTKAESELEVELPIYCKLIGWSEDRGEDEYQILTKIDKSSVDPTKLVEIQITNLEDELSITVFPNAGYTKDDIDMLLNKDDFASNKEDFVRMSSNVLHQMILSVC